MQKLFKINLKQQSETITNCSFFNVRIMIEIVLNNLIIKIFSLLENIVVIHYYYYVRSIEFSTKL